MPDRATLRRWQKAPLGRTHCVQGIEGAPCHNDERHLTAHKVKRRLTAASGRTHATSRAGHCEFRAAARRANSRGTYKRTHSGADQSVIRLSVGRRHICRLAVSRLIYLARVNIYNKLILARVRAARAAHADCSYGRWRSRCALVPAPRPLGQRAR
jgi:hypothetical protein